MFYADGLPPPVIIFPTLGGGGSRRSGRLRGHLQQRFQLYCRPRRHRPGTGSNAGGEPEGTPAVPFVGIPAHLLFLPFLVEIRDHTLGCLHSDLFLDLPVFLFF